MTNWRTPYRIVVFATSVLRGAREVLDEADCAAREGGAGKLSTPRTWFCAGPARALRPIRLPARERGGTGAGCADMPCRPARASGLG